MRKIVWISTSLLMLILLAWLARDVFVGVILERHTAQTCGKLLGGECAFAGKQREGNTLTLHDVEVKKTGVGSAKAQDIVIQWQYDWKPPFVLFDVKINKLRGDAAMLPLYGVWRAVKHASARKGIRLRSWSFDDVALRTPSGNVSLPSLTLSGNKGLVAAHAKCVLPTLGLMEISGNHNGTWTVNMAEASIPEINQLINCWTGSAIPPFLNELKGSVSMQTTYGPAGVVGSIFVHQLSSPKLAVANITIDVSADRHLKNWEFKGQLGTLPLTFKALVSHGLITKVKGTLEGKDVSLKDLLSLGGEQYRDMGLEGSVDISGEFDNQGLFATFLPHKLMWKLGAIPVALHSHSQEPFLGKIWISFTKGIERLWLDLNQSHLSWGSNVNATIGGNIELYKDAIRAQNLKACCGGLIVEASLLGSTQTGGQTLFIAEGGKTRIGAFMINRFEANLDPSLRLNSIKVEGSAPASHLQDDLKALGIEWKGAPTLPGKVKVSASYEDNGNLQVQGRWKSDPFKAQGKLHGYFQDKEYLNIKDFEAVVDLTGVGIVARYAIEPSSAYSFINFQKKTLDILGQWTLPALKNKKTTSGSFQVTGPWNNMTYIQGEHKSSNQ